MVDDAIRRMYALLLQAQKSGSNTQAFVFVLGTQAYTEWQIKTKAAAVGPRDVFAGHGVISSQSAPPDSVAFVPQYLTGE